MLGGRQLLWSAGEGTRSSVRFASRLLVAYLLYQVLVVIPVAVWLGWPLETVVRQMTVRFLWLFFPVLVTLCADDGARKLTFDVLVAAAGALAVWGLYVAATGNGRLYVAEGSSELRYRALGPLAVAIFFWPLALAASGSCQEALYHDRTPDSGCSWAGAHQLPIRAYCHDYGRPYRGGTGRQSAAVGCMACARVTSRAGDLIRLRVGVADGAGLHTHSSAGLQRRDRRGSGWSLGDAWAFVRVKPLNDFVWTQRRYMLDVRYKDPHNFILEVVQNEGLVGLAFYALILLSVVRAALPRLKHDEETRALFCFLLAYLVFSLANANWYSLATMPLLVVAVAGLAVRSDQLSEVGGDAGSDDGRLAVASPGAPTSAGPRILSRLLASLPGSTLGRGDERDPVDNPEMGAASRRTYSRGELAACPTQVRSYGPQTRRSGAVRETARLPIAAAARPRARARMLGRRHRRADS